MMTNSTTKMTINIPTTATGTITNSSLDSNDDAEFVKPENPIERKKQLTEGYVENMQVKVKFHNNSLFGSTSLHQLKPNKIISLIFIRQVRSSCRELHYCN